MTTLFYAPDIAASTLLPEEEALHCTRVLRYRTGETITVTDGKGTLYNAIIEDDSPKHCTFNILNSTTQPLPASCVHLAIAPTKNIDRMEWLTEKAVELGVHAISFIRTANSERRDMKLQRIKKIAVSAMKQSWNVHLPLIEDMCDFSDFLKRWSSQPHSLNCCGLIAHCHDSNTTPRLSVKQACPHNANALLLIGPEGDFTTDEINAALAAGCKPVTLYNARLRTETAALAAIMSVFFLNSL